MRTLCLRPESWDTTDLLDTIARVGARWRGDPEIPHHVIAVGITKTVDSALDVGAQMDGIHRQGGIAIAAHPGPMFWKGFEPVMDRLDGAEICHPAIYAIDEAQAVFEQFSQRTSAAAIGSSDFHGLGRLGLCYIHSSYARHQRRSDHRGDSRPANRRLRARGQGVQAIPS